MEGKYLATFSCYRVYGSFFSRDVMIARTLRVIFDGHLLLATLICGACTDGWKLIQVFLLSVVNRNEVLLSW